MTPANRLIRQKEETIRLLQEQMKDNMRRIVKLRGEIREGAKERQEMKVEHCKNWMEISLPRGKHCFNCVRRDGYPYRAQPDKKCANFKRRELRKSKEVVG